MSARPSVMSESTSFRWLLNIAMGARLSPVLQAALRAFKESDLGVLGAEIEAPADYVTRQITDMEAEHRSLQGQRRAFLARTMMLTIPFVFMEIMVLQDSERTSTAVRATLLGGLFVAFGVVLVSQISEYELREKKRKWFDEFEGASKMVLRLSAPPEEYLFDPTLIDFYNKSRLILRIKWDCRHRAYLLDKMCAISSLVTRVYAKAIGDVYETGDFGYLERVERVTQISLREVIAVEGEERLYSEWLVRKFRSLEITVSTDEDRALYGQLSAYVASAGIDVGTSIPTQLHPWEASVMS